MGIDSWIYDDYVWQHKEEEELVARVLSAHYLQAHLTG